MPQEKRGSKSDRDRNRRRDRDRSTRRADPWRRGESSVESSSEDRAHSRSVESVAYCRGAESKAATTVSISEPLAALEAPILEQAKADKTLATDERPVESPRVAVPVVDDELMAKQESLVTERLDVKGAQRKENREQQQVLVEQQQQCQEENLAKLQQAATLSILQVLKQLAAATPDSIDDLKRDLLCVLEEELPKTRCHQEILKAQASKVLVAAHHFVRTLKDQRESKEERAEEARKTLLRQLEELVVAAEARVETVRLEAIQLVAISSQLCRSNVESAATTEVDVLQLAGVLETRGQLAFADCKRSNEFFMANKAEVLQTSDGASIVAAVEERIHDAILSVIESIQNSQKVKEEIAQRLLVATILASQSKGAVNATTAVSAPSASAVCSAADGSAVTGEPSLADSAVKSFPKVELQLEDHGAASTPADRRAEVTAALGALLERLHGVVEPATTRVRLEAEQLARGHLVEDFVALACAVAALEASVGQASDELEEIRQKAGVVVMGSSGGRLELAKALRPQLMELNQHVASLERRLEEASDVVVTMRQLATHKELSACEEIRFEVAVALRAVCERFGVQGIESLVDAVASVNGLGIISESGVNSFLATHNVEMPKERVAKFFALAWLSSPSSPADSGAGGVARGATMSRDDFTRLMRVYYKVVRDIALSDKLSIEHSRPIRRLDVGEVVEVLQGPSLDTSMGFYRVAVTSLRDEASGWVTVQGAEGVTFLIPGGSIFRVQAPLPLTVHVDDLEGERGKVKALRRGDVLKVLTWCRRASPGCPYVTRIQARVRGCNSFGWATIADHDGTVYLVPA